MLKCQQRECISGRSNQMVFWLKVILLLNLFYMNKVFHPPTFRKSTNIERWRHHRSRKMLFEAGNGGWLL